MSIPAVTFNARVSATELIVGEPLDLEVVLRWERPIEGTTLISTATLLEITAEHDGVKVETSPHSRDHIFSGASPWENETISLSSQDPEWRKTYKLQYSFPIHQPGRYTFTAEWRPREATALVEERMSKKFPGQQVIFLAELKQKVSSSTTITCPISDVDKNFYLHAAGKKCPEGVLVWPSFVQPPNDGRALAEEYPASTYAAYILKIWVPDYTSWRYKTKPPREFVQAALADGQVKEFSPKWERVFKLVEINLQGGNTPQPLRSRFWMYYGERLLLRGRPTEAKAAFEQAVRASMREDSVYVVRSKAFLEVLEDLRAFLQIGVEARIRQVRQIWTTICGCIPGVFAHMLWFEDGVPGGFWAGAQFVGKLLKM